MANTAHRLRRLLPLRSTTSHMPSPSQHPLFTRWRYQRQKHGDGVLELSPQNPSPQLANTRTRRRQPHPAPTQQSNAATPIRASPHRQPTRTRTKTSNLSEAITDQNLDGHQETTKRKPIPSPRPKHQSTRKEQKSERPSPSIDRPIRALTTT